MAAGPTIGKAYIELHADAAPFDRELAARIKESVEKAAPETKRSGRKLGDKLGEGVEEGFDKRHNRFRRVLDKVGTTLRNYGSKWGKAWNDTFEKMAKGNFILTRLFGQLVLGATRVGKTIFNLAGAFFNLGRGIGEVFIAVGQLAVEGFKNLVGGAGDVGRALTSFSSAVARIGSSVAAMAAEIVSFLPAAAAAAAVITLLAAAFGTLLIVLATVAAPFAMLVNFAFALPAALTALLAIILPLVIALHNLGDVMKLVGETDSKKFAEGMKKLSKPLQQLTLTLRSFMPMFKQISDAIQTAFFGPILKQLAPTLKALGPSLQAGLTPVAAALGNLVAKVLQFLASPEVQGFLITILPQAAAMIQNLTPSIIALLGALTAAAAAATPLVKSMSDAFAGLLNKFASWLQTAINDGRFEKWLQTAKDDLNSILALVGSLIDLFKTLFTNLDSGGRSFIDKITTAINRFTTWLKSPQGQKAMENMVTLANLVADAFGLALSYVQKVLTVINTIVDAWKWLRDHSIGGLLTNHGGSTSNSAPTFTPGLSPNQQSHHSYSGGGVVPYDQLAMVHRGEPILDPANSLQRNRRILSDAGMLDAISGSRESVVNVYIGDERLNEKIDYRVARGNRSTATSLSAGSRN